MAEQKLLQSSERPPAQPSYVLRGHAAQVHAVHFFRGNTRLLTGDANGWVVLWALSSKRAVAVWKPHTSTILGVNNWGEDRIITHGRDGKIHVWQLREEDEKNYSKILPIDSSDDSTQHKDPWLLHSLPVNALNFCSFSMIATQNEGPHDLPTEGVLLSTPGFQDGSINITSLPEENRIATIPKPAHVENAGMTMALGLVFSSTDNSTSKSLLVLAGYESGHACIWIQPSSSASSSSSTSTTVTVKNSSYQCLYTYKAHSQPILSLALSLTPPSSSSSLSSSSSSCFYTSGADAIIARHSLPLSSSSSPSAQQKLLQTRHAGQQGLTVRNDNQIFATAGWDGRVRVYSVQSFKEVAVLKWHKEGCYAVGFADVADGEGGLGGGRQDGEEAEVEGAGVEGAEGRMERLSVAEKREEKAKRTHWLAAGSKDGKVSLWDIY